MPFSVNYSNCAYFDENSYFMLVRYVPVGNVFILIVVLGSRTTNWKALWIAIVWAMLSSHLKHIWKYGITFILSLYMNEIRRISGTCLISMKAWYTHLWHQTLYLFMHSSDPCFRIYTWDTTPSHTHILAAHECVCGLMVTNSVAEHSCYRDLLGFSPNFILYIPSFNSSVLLYILSVGDIALAFQIGQTQWLVEVNQNMYNYYTIITKGRGRTW